MNPELPRNPREEMELRITALLLGELSAEEAGAVREAIASDPALAKLHDDLKATIQLVRTATTRIGEPAANQATPLQLSEARRQKLLTSFAFPPLKPEHRKVKPAFQFRFVEALAVLAIVAALAAMLLPSAYFAKRPSAITALPGRRAEEEVLSLIPMQTVDGSLAGGEAFASLPDQSVAGVPSANAGGFADVVTLSAPRDPETRRVEVSGEVAGSRGNDALEARYGRKAETDFKDRFARAQRSLAAGESVASSTPTVPPPATTQPRLQIALPSLNEADTDGLADAGARQKDRSTVPVTLYANGLDPTRGLDRNGRDPSGPAETPAPQNQVSGTYYGGSYRPGNPTEAPASQNQWAASSTLRGFYDSSGRQTTTDSGISDDARRTEAGRAFQERYGLARSIAPTTDVSAAISDPDDQTHTINARPMSVSDERKAASLKDSFVIGAEPKELALGEPVRGLNDPVAAGDLAFGTFKSDGLERGRTGSVEAKPVEVAAGASVAPERYYRFSGGAGGVGGAGRGDAVTLSDEAAKVPVLGDLPMVGKLFRSEPETAAAQTPQIAANDFATLNPETAQGKLGADKQAWFEANNPRDGSTVNAGTLAFGLPGIEQKKELPADSFYAGDKLSADGGRGVPEQPALGFEVADNSAGVAAKPSDVAAIVLPSTPTTKSVDEQALGRRASTQLSRRPAPDSGVTAGNTPAPVQEARRLSEGETRLKARNGVIEAGLAEEQQAGANREQQIAQKGNEVAAGLRQIVISDPDVAGTAPTPSLEADTLRRYQTELIQSKAKLAELEASVGKSQAASPGQQKRVESAKVDVGQLQALVENTKKLDIEKSEDSRTYFAKKRELEEAERLRAALTEMEREEMAELSRKGLTLGGMTKSGLQRVDQEEKIRQLREELIGEREGMNREEATVTARRSSTNAPFPQPEIQTSENNFSTFSLNVSDVSFKLAAASLEQGQMPDAASVRSEEFINAFDYRDPEPAPGLPIAFAWERSRYPFAHNRDLLRFSLKTSAAGRQAERPLNVVLLLDNSGSMERADRVHIIGEALRVLAAQLQSQDKLSIITFARTPRLVADGISGDKADELAEQVSGLTPQGGTNLEDAMNLAYQTAAKHYVASGINRVVLLTDGAANLGNVEPETLKQKVEAQRKQGIALDAFGIGWEGFNDDLLEVLSRNGDGRYGFINSPEETATDFVGQLAGALKVAASDVKVQVEFNPKRATAYRQIGYAKHQLTKEQFRDNTVDAAEIAAQEAGNALYTVEVDPAGEGPLGTVRVRYKIPGTTDYREQAWDVPFTGSAAPLEHSSPAMRLAASASAFSEWLVASPFAGEVTPDRLLGYLGGVPEVYGADARPKKLEWMIRQAKSLEGK